MSYNEVYYDHYDRIAWCSVPWYIGQQLAYFYYAKLNYVTTAMLEQVKVMAVVQIDVDLQEIRAANITAANKRRQFNFTKSLVTINNTLYLETIQKRSFAARFISTDHYGIIQSLQTINSRLRNKSYAKRLSEIKKLMVPLEKQAYLNSHANCNRTRNGDQIPTRSWSAKLLPTTESVVEQVQIELPVSTFNVTIGYLLRCDV